LNCFVTSRFDGYLKRISLIYNLIGNEDTEELIETEEPGKKGCWASCSRSVGGNYQIYIFAMVFSFLIFYNKLKTKKFKINCGFKDLISEEFNFSQLQFINLI